MNETLTVNSNLDFTLQNLIKNLDTITAKINIYSEIAEKHIKI